jgi:hypothetical protein
MPDVVEVGFDAVEQQQRGDGQQGKAENAERAGVLDELVEDDAELFLAGGEEPVDQELLDTPLELVQNRPDPRTG